MIAEIGSGELELSVIVPCFNERDNIAVLIEKLEAALDGIEWEVIFVDDDSPDGTSSVVRAQAITNRRVRCIQRIGRRGLSTAVIEGMLASSAPYVAVIDADLQHDERLLPKMLSTLKAENLDLVIGSRYIQGGGIGDWDKSRAVMSALATHLSRLIVRQPISDPMSGFFIITRAAFDLSVRRLSGQGFKILLDLFASTPKPYRFRELPYTFRARLHGQSKLDSFVAFEYLFLVADKLIGWFVPLRLMLFGIVGATGVVVHLGVLRLALTGLAFPIAQALATVAAMTSNFFLNNMLTYRDRRLRGGRLIVGLLSFFLVCSVGAIANVGIAAAIFQQQYSWWISALAGIAVGLVWNYAVSSVFTWRSR